MKNELFEIYANYVWPLVRPFMTLSPRCKRCILNDRASALVEGLCQECRNYRPTEIVQEMGESSPELNENFQRRIQSLVSSKTYDCVYLLSGGKDSAYVLYRLRQEFPQLKILAITVNNGFMSPYAIGNAQMAALKLNVDWLLHNSRIDLFRKTLRESFLKLNGLGCSGVIDHADGSLIFDTAKQLAKERAIPAIISGMSWVQVQRILGQNHFEMTQVAGIAEIFPLAVWRINEQQIRKAVRDWKLMAKGSDSPLVSNSSLITAMAVLDLKNLGYSSFEPEFAQLIRENKSDRDQWLRIFQLLEFAVKKGILEKDLINTLSALGLNYNDVCKKTNRETQ